MVLGGMPENFDQRLLGALEETAASERLKEAMAYTLSSGGKRVRPLLLYTLLSDFEAMGTKVQADPFYFAAALESIHTYSLIHDDLPAMDDDDERRGKPSNHKVFGEAVAILAGDGLLSFSMELALKGIVDWGARGLLAARHLYRAAGIEGMVDGQVLDIEGLGGEVELFSKKTGMLVAAPLAMAAALATGSEETAQKFFDLGMNLGISYQYQDDGLDYEGDDELELQRLRDEATRYTEKTLEELANLGEFPGTRALIEKILRRDH
ncbi:MAG: polyprenyl synthetase family protein [Tissierellia bacterium]|nr:polyprenyl synthetase family protein [Tissierellia bacterium]